MNTWKNIKDFYIKYENHLSSISLLLGFLFDILILTRIDMPAENLWIISHLVVAVIGIIIINLYENQAGPRGEIGSIYYWLTILVQFAFGGLLSTFLVFYFRSSTLITSWPFLLILASAFAGNEIFKQHYSRLTFQLSYFFLSTFLFLIYYIPILLQEFGARTFIISGIVSLALSALLVLILYHLTREKFKKSFYPLIFSIAGIYVILNILYFTNIMPPIPLSLKDAGVYHLVVRNSAGDYDVTHEKYRFVDYFRKNEVFNYTEGESVYIYSAVFSPTNLNTDIIHEWQYYNDSTGEWVGVSKITLKLLGGREGGFRTYSLADNIFPGLWRVNVKTPTDQTVGRINFVIQEANQAIELIKSTKT